MTGYIFMQAIKVLEQITDLIDEYDSIRSTGKFTFHAN